MLVVLVRLGRVVPRVGAAAAADFCCPEPSDSDHLLLETDRDQRAMVLSRSARPLVSALKAPAVQSRSLATPTGSIGDMKVPMSKFDSTTINYQRIADNLEVVRKR